MRTGTLLLLDWVTTPQLADLAGVDRTTAMRWRRGDRPAPLSVHRLLEMYHGGHVGPRAGDAWRGWWFDVDGLLRPPDMRNAIDARELRAYMLLRASGARAGDAYTLMARAG